MARKPVRKTAKPKAKRRLPAKKAPEQALLGLRRKIDALDERLSKLLIERIGIVQKVARLKSAHWPSSCHIRSGREGEMHVRVAKRFKGTAFASRAAVFLWRQIIGSSTTLESPLNIAYLMGHPAHYWLAREYFGPLIGLTAVAAPSLAEGSNVLVLPAPETPGTEWWRHIVHHQGKQLFIFARLPLLDEELPDDAVGAVALAPITPEPSGDDISYFLLKTKSPQDVVTAASPADVIEHGTDYLLIADGFLSVKDAPIARLPEALGGEFVSLEWLGAHPRPLKLPRGNHD